MSAVRLVDRRSFLITSGYACAGFVGAGVAGCAAAAVPLAPVVSGAVLSAALSPVFEAGYDWLLGEFAPGHFLHVPVEGVEFERGVPRDIQQAFLAVSDVYMYSTPVVKHSEGQVRYVQLPLGSGWGLMTGGHNRDTAYSIRSEWIKYLLVEDNCNLVVDGDTYIETCNDANCNIRIYKQNFVNNDDVLGIPIREGASRAALDLHDRHTNAFEGCPEVLASQPEICI